MNTIGKNIMTRRKELGLTQLELAKRMGYASRSTINKIELGVNDIPQSKVKLFAEALHTSVAYIMGWEEEERTAQETRYQEELLSMFEQLNDEGKDQAIKMVEALTLINEYKKSNPVQESAV